MRGGPHTVRDMTQYNSWKAKLILNLLCKAAIIPRRMLFTGITGRRLTPKWPQTQKKMILPGII